MDEMCRWAAAAAGGIRFRPDREAAQQELLEHLLDKQELLMRARGLDRKQAAAEAVRQMGDAGQVREALARVHSPWLGRLWQASRVLLVLLLALSLFHWGPGMVQRLHNRWELAAVAGQNDPLEPYEGGNPHFGDLIQLWTRESGESVRAGDYLFRVEKTALWAGPEGEAGDFRALYCRLTARGLPWQPFSREAARHIRATDSTGRSYLSTYETHTLHLTRDEQGAVLTQPDYARQDRSTFALSAVVPAEAAWLRLEFDRGSTVWSLTIPLGEDVP